MSELPEAGGRVLGRHKHHERLSEVPGYLLEHEAVVRVDYNEQRLPGERVQVARVETVGLLAALETLSARRRGARVIGGLAFSGRRDAPEVVAH